MGVEFDTIISKRAFCSLYDALTASPSFRWQALRSPCTSFIPRCAVLLITGMIIDLSRAYDLRFSTLRSLDLWYSKSRAVEAAVNTVLWKHDLADDMHGTMSQWIRTGRPRTALRKL